MKNPAIYTIKFAVAILLLLAFTASLPAILTFTIEEGVQLGGWMQEHHYLTKEPHDRFASSN